MLIKRRFDYYTNLFEQIYNYDVYVGLDGIIFLITQKRFTNFDVAFIRLRVYVGLDGIIFFTAQKRFTSFDVDFVPGLLR